MASLFDLTDILMFPLSDEMQTQNAAFVLAMRDALRATLWDAKAKARANAKANAKAKAKAMAEAKAKAKALAKTKAKANAMPKSKAKANVRASV